VKTTPVAWDRLDSIGLVRQLEAVAARRGLAFGWIDASGPASLPHRHDDRCEGGGCVGSVGDAVRATDDPWLVVSPHPRLREIAAPIKLGRSVAGALLVGGYTDGALSEGEVGLLGELLAEAAREVADAAMIAAPSLGAAPRASFGEIIGGAPAMQQLYGTLARVARSDSTVLIQGENGTGKELVARAIHQGSPRATRPFVVTNCSAFNDNLLDSELFGHKRGAFTGAVSDKPGLFEVADTGTVLPRRDQATLCRRPCRSRSCAGCLGRMMAYPWPGNVRELENEIERLVVLSGDDTTIEEELLSSRIRHHHAEPSAAALLDPGSLPAAVEDLERRMIVESLAPPPRQQDPRLGRAQGVAPQPDPPGPEVWPRLSCARPRAYRRAATDSAMMPGTTSRPGPTFSIEPGG
jgi:hypothetical protein